MPCPWTPSRSGWIDSEHSDLAIGVLVHLRGVELNDFCGSLPTSMLLL